MEVDPEQAFLSGEGIAFEERPPSPSLLTKSSTAKALNDLSHTFDELDVKNVGFLDCKDIARLLVSMGSKEAEAEKFSSIVFSMLDINRDGRISRREFLDGACAVIAGSDRTLKHRRSIISRRTAQKNTKKAVVDSLIKPNTPPSGMRLNIIALASEDSIKIEDLRMVFELVDVDKSGYISIQELTCLMKDSLYDLDNVQMGDAQDLLTSSSVFKAFDAQSQIEVLNLAQDRVANTFRLLDTSGDGNLDFEEFCVAFEGIIDIIGRELKGATRYKNGGGSGIEQAQVRSMKAEIIRMQAEIMKAEGRIRSEFSRGAKNEEIIDAELEYAENTIDALRQEVERYKGMTGELSIKLKDERRAVDELKHVIKEQKKSYETLAKNSKLCHESNEGIFDEERELHEDPKEIPQHQQVGDMSEEDVKHIQDLENALQRRTDELKYSNSDCCHKNILLSEAYNLIEELKFRVKELENRTESAEQVTTAANILFPAVEGRDNALECSKALKIDLAKALEANEALKISISKLKTCHEEENNTRAKETTELLEEASRAKHELRSSLDKADETVEELRKKLEEDDVRIQSLETLKSEQVDQIALLKAEIAENDKKKIALEREHQRLDSLVLDDEQEIEELRRQKMELKKRAEYSDRNFQLALAELRKLDPKYYGIRDFISRPLSELELLQRKIRRKSEDIIRDEKNRVDMHKKMVEDEMKRLAGK
eukprot:UC4_evm2s524